ncbi:MAG: sugar phosphate isomerase/epimerase [Deltaproteobacteria bacterium]|nr:sugar phosphate isomerase/epimerase [Deltaproteobacteria bacterium]
MAPHRARPRPGVRRRRADGRAARHRRRSGNRRDLTRLYLDDLAPVLEDAEARGVKLALENIMTPLSRSAALADIIDRVGHRHLGACLDTGHANVNETTLGAIDTLGPRILTTHLHDNHGGDDEHLLPGEGTLDWTLIADALAKLPSKPHLMLELRWPQAGDAPDEQIFRARVRQARERLRDIFGA